MTALKALFLSKDSTKSYRRHNKRLFNPPMPSGTKNNRVSSAQGYNKERCRTICTEESTVHIQYNKLSQERPFFWRRCSVLILERPGMDRRTFASIAFTASISGTAFTTSFSRAVASPLLLISSKACLPTQASL